MIAIATTRVIPPLHLPGGRAWAVLALSAIAVCGTLLGTGSLAGAGQATEPPAAVVTPAAAPRPARVHVVQPGDTLWSVARGLQPAGDVRPLVARLRAASGAGPLVPGQRLRLDA